MPQDNRKPKTASSLKVAAKSNNIAAYAKKLLLDQEDPAQFRALHDDLVRRHDPEGSLEEQLVFEMASLLWRKRRGALAETALLHLKGATHLLRHQRLLLSQLRAMRAELAILQNNRRRALANRKARLRGNEPNSGPTRRIQTGARPQPRLSAQ